MITSYSIENPFEFLGVSYKNLQQFRDQLTEIDKHPDPLYRIVTDNRQNLFLIRFELYPCFDSSDRIYENRHYRYLFYCKDREELAMKLKYLKDITYLSTGAQNNPKLIPNLFYGEDTLFFEIAEKDAIVPDFQIKT
ncbi:MAG: hypothetical protein ACOYNC_02135 [Bacteroidales bacterium]